MTTETTTTTETSPTCPGCARAAIRARNRPGTPQRCQWPGCAEPGEFVVAKREAPQGGAQRPEPMPMQRWAPDPLLPADVPPIPEAADPNDARGAGSAKRETAALWRTSGSYEPSVSTFGGVGDGNKGGAPRDFTASHDRKLDEERRDRDLRKLALIRRGGMLATGRPEAARWIAILDTRYDGVVRPDAHEGEFIQIDNAHGIAIERERYLATLPRPRREPANTEEANERERNLRKQYGGYLGTLANLAYEENRWQSLPQAPEIPPTLTAKERFLASMTAAWAAAKDAESAGQAIDEIVAKPR